MDTIDRLIQQIQSRYNANFDLCADGPSVRWAEFTLAEIVKNQQAEIAALKVQVERLTNAVPSAGPPRDDGSNRGRHKLFYT